jgi:hypothetical protein
VVLWSIVVSFWKSLFRRLELRNESPHILSVAGDIYRLYPSEEAAQKACESLSQFEELQNPRARFSLGLFWLRLVLKLRAHRPVHALSQTEANAVLRQWVEQEKQRRNPARVGLVANLILSASGDSGSDSGIG